MEYHDVLCYSIGVKHICHIVVALTFLVLLGCTIPFGMQGPMMVVARAGRIRIAWNASGSGQIGATAIKRYELYYREYTLEGSGQLRFLGSIPANANADFQVDSNTVKPGLYEFAVRAVSVLHVPSDFEYSVDRSHDVYGGWYLAWLGE